VKASSIVTRVEDSVGEVVHRRGTRTLRMKITDGREVQAKGSINWRILLRLLSINVPSNT
jgi:hypothetical protein